MYGTFLAADKQNNFNWPERQQFTCQRENTSGQGNCLLYVLFQEIFVQHTPHPMTGTWGQNRKFRRNKTNCAISMNFRLCWNYGRGSFIAGARNISKMVNERQSNQRRPVFPLLRQPSAKIGAGNGTVSAEMASSSFCFSFLLFFVWCRFNISSFEAAAIGVWRTRDRGVT